MQTLIVKVYTSEEGKVEEVLDVVTIEEAARLLALPSDYEDGWNVAWREAREFEVADSDFVDERMSWQLERAAVLEAAGNPDFFTLMVSWDKAKQDCVFSVRC